jgi:hypothetical protein
VANGSVTGGSSGSGSTNSQKVIAALSRNNTDLNFGYVDSLMNY